METQMNMVVSCEVNIRSGRRRGLAGALDKKKALLVILPIKQALDGI